MLDPPAAAELEAEGYTSVLDNQGRALENQAYVLVGASFSTVLHVACVPALLFTAFLGSELKYRFPSSSQEGLSALQLWCLLRRGAEQPGNWGLWLPAKPKHSC